MRTRYFKSLGFVVIRFTNVTIAKEFPSVMETIRGYVAELIPPAS